MRGTGIVITQEVTADALCDARGGGLDGVPGKMGVPGGRLHLGMAEQFPNHGQALAERQCARGKAVPEVVDPHVFEAGALADAPPGALKVGEMRAGEAARDDPGIAVLAGNGRQHRAGLGTQRHHSPETVLTIARLLGHRNPETTLKYTHLADKTVMDAAETVGAALDA